MDSSKAAAAKMNKASEGAGTSTSKDCPVLKLDSAARDSSDSWSGSITNSNADLFVACTRQKDAGTSTSKNCPVLKLDSTVRDSSNSWSGSISNSNADLFAACTRQKDSGTVLVTLDIRDFFPSEVDINNRIAVATRRPQSGAAGGDVAIEMESEGESIYHSFVNAEEPVRDTPPETAPATGSLAGAAESPVIDQTQSARRPRNNTGWWYNIRDGMSSLAPFQKTMIVTRMILAFARIIAGIVVLIVSALRDERAQRPLQAFIIIYISRLAVYYPLYFNRKVHRFGSSWPNLRIAKHLQTMKYSKKKGADFAQISKIPLVKYVDPELRPPQMSVSSPPSLHGHENTSFVLPACPTAAQSSTSLHSATSDRRHGVSQIHILRPFVRIAHRLSRSRRQRAAEMELYKKQLASPVKDFTPSDPEDRMCAICLSDYEDGEILRLLPCDHHMHQSCVDEWLHINKSCPLCKQEAIETTSPPSKDAESNQAANTETATTTAANSGDAQIHSNSADADAGQACAPIQAQTPATANMPSMPLPVA
ncbi:hypothetical protein GGF39_001074 [Coemansia sp. RSA 1721]|nr:hypothetical protein GGF39_001074 [Coemansia sp. RSA 1721]